MIPMISLPLKETTEIDFGPSFRDYITSKYQEDPDKYAKEISMLNEYREEIRTVEKDTNGRNKLYRYYGQVELLSLRFPIDEQQVKIEFCWADAFSKRQECQYSIAFEKACVLYNIGAICSSIAATQDRESIQGLKVAYNYFQVAAGMLQFINDNFLHPPSTDISRESITVLVDLLLAQAQECFIEKVLSENKSGNLVARLASHVSNVYVTIQEAIKYPSLKNQFDNTWIEIFAVKQKYYSSLAYYHRSKVSETESAYGEIQSFLEIANSNASDAINISKKLYSSFPSLLSGLESILSPTSPSLPPATVANELIAASKELKEVINSRLQIAIKDNDLIYHAPSIPADSLPAIEKLNAVKVLSFHDLLPNGQKDIPPIVGYDIFHKLVPMEVHVSSSVYSDSKDMLSRAFKQEIETADTDLIVQIDSLNVSSTLQKLKNAISSNLNNPLLSQPPDSLLKSLGQIGQLERSSNQLEQLAFSIKTGETEMKQIFDEIARMLDEEQYTGEQMRIKYFDRWTQEPSQKRNQSLKSQWASFGDYIQQLSREMQYFATKVAMLATIIERSLKPAEAIQIEFSVQSDLSTKKRTSLMDAPLDEESESSVKADVQKMNLIEGLTTRLKGLKDERAKVFEDFKERSRLDDICSSILVNKGREEQLFKTELAKYSPFENKLKENVALHRQLLDQLITEFKSLLQSSDILNKIEIKESKKKTVVSEWERDIEAYYEIQSNMQTKVQSLEENKHKLYQLRNSVVDFVNQRNMERNSLLSRINSQLAEENHSALQSQLNRVSITSNVGIQAMNSSPQAAPYPISLVQRPVVIENSFRPPIPQKSFQPVQLPPPSIGSLSSVPIAPYSNTYQHLPDSPLPNNFLSNQSPVYTYSNPYQIQGQYPPNTPSYNPSNTSNNSRPPQNLLD